MNKEDESGVELDSEDTNLTDWKNAPTLADLKVDLAAAKIEHDKHISKVDNWMLNLAGGKELRTRKNRSTLRPKVIRKNAEWRYAALSEPFLSTDDIFNASAVTYEDVVAARHNQLLLNNQFNNQIDKVAFIDEYVRTAVDEGTVIVRVGWDFEEDVVETEVPIYDFVIDEAFGPTLEQLAQEQQAGPDVFEVNTPDHLKVALALTMESQQPFAPVDTGETKTISSTTTVKNQPSLEVCDYRNLIVDPTCTGSLRKAKFVIYSFKTSISELTRSGIYKNLDKIIVESAGSVLADPDHASGENSSFTFEDKPRKELIAYEYWGYWDIEESGMTKPFVATWVGNTLIRMEENPYPDKGLPFVKVPYLPVRRSAFGEPDGELLEDNQKVVGAITRGMIDIMARSSNGQVGTGKDALDVTNRRRYENGEDYQYNPNVNPAQSFYMHKFEEIPQSAPILLAQQQQEAESLTGVIPFNNGISGAALGSTATAARSALDAASKRELGILRRLAAGIVEIGYKMMSMNSQFLEELEVVRVTNEEFLPIRKDSLGGKVDLKLTISTAEEDNAQAESMGFLLQTIGPNADQGMVNIVMAEISRLRKRPDLAKKLENFQPQPDPLEVRRQELEVELLQAKIETERARAAEYMSDANLQNARAGSEGVKAENLQADTSKKTLDFVEQESGVKQERELEKQGAQARAQAETKKLEHRLKATDKILDL